MEGAENGELDEGSRVADRRAAVAGDYLAFLALAALVVAAGVVVSWSAKRIATHEFVTPGGILMLGETFVGSLLVAVATSLPEVTVAFSAMRRTDSPDMALGTLLGSNSFNLLVFAVGAPFISLGPTNAVSAWSNLASVNIVNVVVALGLTVLVLHALRARSRGAAARWPAALMMAGYAVGLLAVYQL